MLLATSFNVGEFFKAFSKAFNSVVVNIKSRWSSNVSVAAALALSNKNSERDLFAALAARSMRLRSVGLMRRLSETEADMGKSLYIICIYDSQNSNAISL